MKIKNNVLLIVLVLSLFFLGLNLSWLFEKENLNSITFSDFKYSIGSFLSSLALFMSYIAALKEEIKK